MSLHSFDPIIAKKAGLNAAVIYQNLLFWCEKNKANNRHNYDNKWWTYNSISAFSELFPYLSPKQVRTALDKLEELKLIESGCFNKSNYDRTKWYTCICLNGSSDLPKKANENAQEGKPIPDSNTDGKTDSKKINKKDIDFPTNISEAAWGDWVKYRSEIKKTLKPSTIKQQLKFLSEQENADEVIYQSIRNGWAGLFPLKNNQPQKRSVNDLDGMDYTKESF